MATSESNDRADKKTRAMALVVLGMHRSGTSALARVLNVMGADVPGELMPADEYNEKGYWESKAIADFQDEILKSAKVSWDHIGGFDRNWYGSPAEAEFRSRAVELLRRLYGDSRLFLMKDPRTSILVPFWSTVFQEFGAEPVYIVAVRHPLEVAQSLARRNQFSTSKSLLLWLGYTLDAERDSRGKPRCFVAYDQLLNDWQSCVKLVGKTAGLDWTKPPSEAKKEIDALISEGLRHHSAKGGALEMRADTVWWVTRAYQSALTAATGSNEGLVTTFDEIIAAFDAAVTAFGPLIGESTVENSTQSPQYQRVLNERDTLRRELTDTQSAAGEVLHRVSGRLADNRKFGLKDLVPISGVDRVDNGCWNGNSLAPRFLIAAPPLDGSVRLHAKIRSSVWSRACLYLDSGSGFVESDRIELASLAPGETIIDREIPLLLPVRLFRFDPIQNPGEFTLLEFSLEQTKVAHPKSQS
jgi:hypothetical protein